MNLSETEDTMQVDVALGVAKGTCVMFDQDGEIAYAGPLTASNRPDGKDMLVVLSPEDFGTFLGWVKQNRGDGVLQ